MKTLSDLPKGAIMDHHHYASPMISPTAHHALRTVIAGSVDILFKTEKFNMRRRFIFEDSCSRGRCSVDFTNGDTKYLVKDLYFSI